MKKWPSLLVLSSFLFFGVHSLFAATLSSRDLPSVVNSVNNLNKKIEKEGQSSRTKYVASLKKMLSKYKKGSRPYLMITEMIKRLSAAPSTSLPSSPMQKQVFQITSSVFASGASIPEKYTCDSKNINMPLSFSGVPAGAKSLALIMHDPDVPTTVRADGNWDHWLVWNIKPTVTEFAENSVPPGVVGVNTDGDNDYVGPCPPDKQHRYFFTLYALDTMLSLPDTANKAELLEAMKGHIIDQAQLTGVYERKNK